MRYSVILLVLIAVPGVAQAPGVPEGQMRGIVHLHTWHSDGLLGTRSCDLWAQRYGAEFAMMSDHAHKLGDTSAMLDSYPKIPGEYRVEMGKMPIDAAGYINEIAGACDVMPTGAWLEVGEESHFLVCLGYGRDLARNAGEIIRLSRQTKTLGTQKVILEIDKILQETGGFMIAAHPCNSRYPFNYNFNGCRSAVGVEFFNGPRSEHWANFRELLRLQRESARPLVATGGADVHIPEGALGELEGAIEKDAARSFFLGGMDELVSYRPSRRFTYIFGRSQNPVVIACQIRDARGYCAYGETVITGISAEPGTKYCPRRTNDTFSVKTRGLPRSVKMLRVAFVDDETSEISEIEVPWTDDFGSRLASFRISQIRKYPHHSGKMFLATEEFVTSAIIVLADPEEVAKKIEELRGSPPIIESPAVPKNSIRRSAERAEPPATGLPFDPAKYSHRYQPDTDARFHGPSLAVFDENWQGWVSCEIGPGVVITRPIKLTSDGASLGGKIRFGNWSAEGRSPTGEVTKYFITGDAHSKDEAEISVWSQGEGYAKLVIAIYGISEQAVGGQAMSYLRYFSMVKVH